MTKIFIWTVLLIVAMPTAAMAGATTGHVGFQHTARGNPTEAQARRVAVAFFRSQNERRYDDTCRLLSHGFYQTHRLPDHRTCVALLRINFMWSGQIQFRIGDIVRDGDRLVVRATADGLPGRIILVREHGTLKILAVEAD